MPDIANDGGGLLGALYLRPSGDADGDVLQLAGVAERGGEHGGAAIPGDRAGVGLGGTVKLATRHCAAAHDVLVCFAVGAADDAAFEDDGEVLHGAGDRLEEGGVVEGTEPDVLGQGDGVAVAVKRVGEGGDGERVVREGDVPRQADVVAWVIPEPEPVVFAVEQVVAVGVLFGGLPEVVRPDGLPLITPQRKQVGIVPIAVRVVAPAHHAAVTFQLGTIALRAVGAWPGRVDVGPRLPIDRPISPYRVAVLSGETIGVGLADEVGNFAPTILPVCVGIHGLPHNDSPLGDAACGADIDALGHHGVAQEGRPRSVGHGIDKVD